MSGFLHLVADEQFFIKFLARAQAGNLDFDVAVGVLFVFHFEAAEDNHLTGKVDDFDGFTHVEDEYVAAFTHCAGLDNQLRRFGNGHEVAGNVLVSQGNRAAFGNLFFKYRNNGTGRTQYIAETHHAEACFLFRLGGKGLQAEFGHAFAGAHGVGRTDGFVGGNQNKGGNACIYGSLRTAECAEHVVLNAFDGVELYHWNVFVGCGMINGVDVIGLHDAAKAFFVLNRTQKRYDFNLAALRGLGFAQLFVYAVQGEFGQFKQQQFGRPAIENLTAKFGADRAACAGYHHDFVADVGAHQFRARCHRGTAEQIDHRDFFQ